MGKTQVEREKETMAVMVGMYCRGKHGAGGLCDECSELLSYARRRIECCPRRDSKVSCARCEIHCYSPEMRERIRAVMRYSGPRMVLHPVMLVRHALS